MKEFQEENLFTGAQQSQGFAPQQAPDTSRFLRENMGQIDRNFANLESQRQAELDNKLQKQIKTLEMFGQFSSKAMQFAQTMGKAYIDSQIIEGQNKARSLGKTLNYGINPQEEEQLNNTLKEEKQNQAAAADVALDMGKQNAPLEAINYIKSLPQYQRIGAYRSYFANKGNTYSEYLRRYVQRSDINLPKPVSMGGGTFTPQEIDDQPELLQIALADASRRFMAEEVGIGGDNNPTPLAAKPLYEAMDKAEDTFLNVVRRNKSINDSEAMVFQATEIYKENGDLNAYLSALTGSLDEKGNIRSRSEALDFIFERMVDEYFEGNTEILNQLDQPVEGDPKGQTFRQRFKNRIEGPQGLEARIDAINAQKLQNRRTQDAIELDNRERIFRDQVKIRRAEGRRFTDDEIDYMLQEAVTETGLSADHFTWFKNYQTQEKFDQELEQKKLDRILDRSQGGRGYLIAADLEGVSTETYRAYISSVKEEALPKIPDQYKRHAREKILALTDRAFNTKTGDAPKSPEFRDTQRNAELAYDLYMQEALEGGASMAEAQKEALQRLNAGFADSEYETKSFLPEPKTQYFRDLTEGRNSLESKEFDMTTTVLPNSTKYLDELDKFKEGRGNMPRYYQGLASGYKHLTAWDIASAQYRASGRGELGKDVKREAFDKLDPTIQAVIAYKPTANKIKRAEFKGSYTTRAAMTSSDSAFQSAARKPINVGTLNSVNHPFFVAIGINEGTRRADGGFNEAYYGHRDPGDANYNRGTVSGGRGNNMTPEQVDTKWTGILAKTQQKYNSSLTSYGLPEGTADYNDIMFNILDLQVQAPAAVSDFVKSIPQIIKEGVTPSVIGKYRSQAFINPRTGRLEASGFGNSMARLQADQTRRAGTFSLKRRGY